MQFRIFSLIVTLFLSSSVIYSQTKQELFAPVKKRLLEKKVDEEFIDRLIDNPNTKFEKKFVKINVTNNFTKPDYSKHYNERSVRKSKEFLEANDSILGLAEKKFNVSKEVITSILWVETRHGGYLGNNNIVSVYLSTAMADEDSLIKYNIDVYKETLMDGSEEFKKIESKIKKRAKYKSKWAIEQLVALSKIEDMIPMSIFEIEGSWAGAFGMSQFLPSSYQNLAVDGDGDNKVDLFNKSDAIFSVANYLKKNGWSTTTKSQRKAVYSYNHSNDYVDAVLKLANLIKS